MAAVDYFLKIDGISGESTDVKHKGEIEVESFSWGVTNTTLTRARGGAGAGRAQFQDLAFNTRVSKASPNLFLKCASGAHIKQAVLTATTMDAKGQSQEFLKITLSDVLVSSYQSIGETQPGPPDLPTDAAFIRPVDTIGIIGPELPADSAKLRYASLEFTEGTPTSVGVQPTSGGTLRFEVKTGTVESYPRGPDNIFTIGAVDGGIQRAVQEYDVKILIGLLTAPFSTARLRLGVNEIREAAINPGLANIASVGADRDIEGPSLHMFDVILYTPADGTLDASDLTRGGKRIGRIAVDPNGDPASSTIDLTELVRRRGLETFGIRLQLHGLELPEPFEGPEDSAHADDHRDDDHDGDDDEARTPFSASFSMNLTLDNQ